MDKFVKHYDTKEKIDQLSDYVHCNYKLIMTKMVSEMRRKLDIVPSLENHDGYISLMVSIHVAVLQEIIFSTAGICQSHKLKACEIIPMRLLKIFLDLWEGKNYLDGRIRSDIIEDLEGFRKYYLENIDELRSNEEALPK